MRRPITLCALLIVAVTLTIGGSRVAGGAQSTPTTGAKVTTMVLIEHADNLHLVDLGEPDPSAGDMQIWGPNPLFNEADSEDTGATTQGTCIALNADRDCMVNETIVFPDGSTLQIQGVELADSPSQRTIVGGTGMYLGATGIVAVEPTDDQSRWTKTIEIVGRNG